MPKDLLDRELNVGDLIAWGHSGRYAGTRIGRVYRIEGRYVRAWIVARESNYDEARGKYVKGAWVKGHHAQPSDPIKIDDTDLDVPRLDQL